MPKRCALGCPPLGLPTHMFPHPEKFPEIFKAWVEIAGGKLEKPGDYQLYRQKIICDIHFTDGDKNRNHRLNALAVPTLHLPCQKVNTDSAFMDVQQREPLISKENLIDCPMNDPKSTLQCLAFMENKNPEDIHISDSASSSLVIQPSAAKENVLPPSLNFPTSKSKENFKDLERKISIVETVALGTLNKPSTSKELTPEASSVFNDNTYSKQNHSQRKVVLTLQASKIRRSASVIIQNAVVKNLKNKINRLTKRNKIYKQRLGNAEKLNNDAAFKRITRHMSSSAKLFTKMQMTETTKKPSGRRFTLEQKILSLSLFKRGARVYKLLSKLFTLPSAKTLRCLLSEIKLGSGLIDTIFDKMKETVKNMNFGDKLCTLIFDEMALTPQLQYDRANDTLKGLGGEKKIADHILVFMIKGVKANYKQPVAYYFTNSVNKYILKNIIKEVIKKVQATGLTVLCTVCDQGSANVGAISELVQDTKNDFLRQGKTWRHDLFEVNKKQIIPLFDVPHLLKGMRNNLLNKDLKYTDFSDNNEEKIVKWSYFQKVYQADKSQGELCMLYKLTEEHLNPEKIKKMRVKNAAQIFSHSVAVATSHLVARKLVDNECRQLIPFVILMDNLFDSLNASTFHIPNGKIYGGCIKRFSPHHELWQNAIRTLKSMKFVIKKKKGNKVQFVESVAPTIKNFIKTIQGMQSLWVILSQKYKFDSMLTRHFNQDPLENFFGSKRSYGVRNIAPNCTSFEGAYKSLLLNNYNAIHSLQANCEKDSYECLQNLKFFFNTNNLENPSNQRDCQDSQENIDFSEEMLTVTRENDIGQSNYVCGWVLKKCLKYVIKGCKTCRGNFLCSNQDRESNEFIKAREYTKDKKWLVYPSKQCEDAFKDIQHITVCVLKKDVPKIQLKKKIKLMVDTLVYFPSTCSTHYETLRNTFENGCVDILIYSWCRSINRILAGKTKYEGDDEMKNIAQHYCNKHRTRK